jgi:hypothetical protein
VFRQGTATIGQESETGGLLVFAGGAEHRYRFNGYLLRLRCRMLTST